jgi:phosphohistidine phosphatase
MLKLYLLRHAEAPMSFDMNDKDRPLRSHGVDQAKKAAESLKNIDHVLCSDALRTKMTFEALIEAGAKFDKVDYLNELYNAPAGDLLNALQRCEAQNILIIAHNPGIHVLANMLVGDGEKSQIEKLNIFYNPATLSVFDCDIKNWSDIHPAQNTLVDLVIPE